MEYKDNSLTPQEIMKITFHSYWGTAEPKLVGFLKRSRENLDPTQLLRLQFEIASEIIKLEKQITRYSKSVNRESHDQTWHTVEIYKTHRRALKQIMDGIAWRWLNFRRAPLRLLSSNHQTGHLSGGFVREMEDAERIVSQRGTHVILNDLTNVLRYGDLTIIDGNTISFYEVKTSSRKDGRAVKQAQKLNSVLDMLNLREHKIGDQTARVVQVPSAPHHLFDKAAKVIVDSTIAVDGISAQRISPYLWLSCISVERFTSNVREKGQFPSFPKSPFKRGRYITPMGNLTMFDSYAPTTPPISIFPLKEEYLVKLMIGKLHLKSIVSEDDLVKSFTGKGWSLRYPDYSLLEERASLTHPRDRREAVVNPLYFPTLSKGIFSVKMPWDLLYRIPLEFLSVKSIVAMLESERLAFFPGDPGTFVTDFRDESVRWK